MMETSDSEDYSSPAESDDGCFSDTDVQFLPEPPERNNFTDAAYDSMQDVMKGQVISNWRKVRDIFAEQFDPAHLRREEEYTGPKPKQFEAFEDGQANSVKPHAETIINFSQICLYDSSVWPDDCCEACRMQGILACQCPVMISMPYAMLEGEHPSSPHIDIQPVVRTLKLVPRDSEAREILPNSSGKQVVPMGTGRVLKYLTYETRYIKPLPAGNFWLPLHHNMHARDQIWYKVCPYVSESIDSNAWEEEYDDMHNRRRDRAAYRRVRDALFNNPSALSEVVRGMKQKLANAKREAGDDEKTFEQKIFKALSNSVPNAPSPDELYEQQYLLPKDINHRNRICVPSLDADPNFDCPYEKRINTFLTMYCPRCRIFDCHTHKYTAPVPEIVVIPMSPPLESDNDAQCCSPAEDCFANIYETIKSVSDFAVNNISLPHLSACAKAYLNDVLHGPKSIPSYYADSGSGKNGGVAECQSCCDATEMVNGFLAPLKQQIRCADTYLFYLHLLGEKKKNASNSNNPPRDPNTEMGNVESSVKTDENTRKQPSFKQAPGYKAHSSKHQSTLAYEPCHHPKFASCAEAAAHASCVCAERGVFCEKFCSCDAGRCGNRARGCNHCTSGCSTSRCPCYVARRECDPQICRCAKPQQSDAVKTCGCKNMAMQFGLKKKIVIAHSTTHGAGAFIMQDAKEGEFVYEYMGEKISDYEAERRGRFYDKVGLSFLFGLNAEESIDATRCGNKIRFANHSERHANLSARIMKVDGEHRIGLYALRDLKRGEELLFNYFYKDDQLRFVPNEPTSLPATRGVNSLKRTILEVEDEDLP